MSAQLETAATTIYIRFVYSMCILLSLEYHTNTWIMFNFVFRRIKIAHGPCIGYPHAVEWFVFTRRFFFNAAIEFDSTSNYIQASPFALALLISSARRYTRTDCAPSGQVYALNMILWPNPAAE